MPELSLGHLVHSERCYCSPQCAVGNSGNSTEDNVASLAPSHNFWRPITQLRCNLMHVAWVLPACLEHYDPRRSSMSMPARYLGFENVLAAIGEWASDRYAFLA